MMPWFRAVRGNHEQMMIDGLSQHGNVSHWLVNGGGWFFNLDYDKERLAKALVHKAASCLSSSSLKPGIRKS
jgi:serine/threonine protein phosphatase 1